MKDLVVVILEKFKHKDINPEVLKRYLQIYYKIKFTGDTLKDRILGSDYSKCSVC